MKKCLHTILVDVDTAEILLHKENDYDVGESLNRQIQKFVDCLYRGLSNGKNLSLRMEIFNQQYIEPDIFECNVSEYPISSEQVY